jgi:predicted dehydrogenase
MEPDAERGLLHTEKDGQPVRQQVPTLQGNYLDYFERIFQALRNNKPLPVTAEDGVHVMRIIEAALRSRKEEKVVHL